jgi:hypothetical protein
VLIVGGNVGLSEFLLKSVQMQMLRWLLRVFLPELGVVSSKTPFSNLTAKKKFNLDATQTIHGIACTE